MNYAYEDRWRERMADYAPPAGDADWNAMQKLLPPQPSGGSWWKARALLLVLVAGWLLWTARPAPTVTLSAFPVASVSSEVPAPAPPPPAAALPALHFWPLAERQRIPGTVPVRETSGPPAPVPLRPVPIVVPTLGLPALGRIGSAAADTLLRAPLDRLRATLPAEAKSGANGYYPPTRTRQ
ncbi:hypothetical protein [Lewinella sp. IMCC34183]|uniref:hypothetical protein n=1 Tax=Lewinella sp. IMCC34183 TaxID=2248762 RepID=UPI000E23F9F1|nr:hypothetical protein [Lewinella sp. IMCC34183]